MKSLDLYYRCPHCQGNGCVYEPGEDALTCGECEGAGYLLTHDGRELIRFIKIFWQKIGLPEEE